MPLRDHFHPPFSNRYPWDSIHGGWPMGIVRQLNPHLPSHYAAGPTVHLGSIAEVDVGTVDQRGAVSRNNGDDGGIDSTNGGVATAVWTAAPATYAVETRMNDTDDYEVRVYDQRYGRRLVAAIEIISPSNKDRPTTRTQLVTKCAALLRKDVCVVLVDVVTERDFNLYAELLGWIDEEDPALGTTPPAIYAVACRWAYRGSQRWLETWHHPLTIGQALPTLPLWLTDDLAIPLDLELSYEQTLRDLRIV